MYKRVNVYERESDMVWESECEFRKVSTRSSSKLQFVRTWRHEKNRFILLHCDENYSRTTKIDYKDHVHLLASVVGETRKQKRNPLDPM